MQVIRVRYWAAARAAAGVAEEDVRVSGAISLLELRAVVADRHRQAPVASVLQTCSVLVGDRPVSSSEPGDVVIEPGDVVEFLPPFAGG